MFPAYEEFFSGTIVVSCLAAKNNTASGLELEAANPRRYLVTTTDTAPTIVSSHSSFFFWHNFTSLSLNFHPPTVR